ncbi:MAG: amino acid adenylation domain-containing protein [Stigonema ocellatum SAG 48.90 = DSM 106950]|nr:amino acid adenylation domain-containing protein [Stigonema ocellatum SAG 48.90 = DSM 106950]
MYKQFSCFLSGHEYFLIGCAELILDRGHQILGVISSGTLITKWAKEKNIHYIQPTDNLIEILNHQPFDYLFNIYNLFALPEEILKLPRQYPINCHDSLLPQYKGFNAPSWAILHQEKTHGITWHVMTVQIDEGDILKQISLDIAKDETAFTLNGKCYEAAIHSFAQLLDDIDHNSVSRSKENLENGTYFSVSEKPSIGCVLSWKRCANDIDAFVRALDFGSNPNFFGVPKLVIGSDFIIVSKIEVLDNLSKEAPGTIIAIESDKLQVSTASHDIALREVLTIVGQPLSIPELVTKYGLQIGKQFKDIDQDRAKRIETIEARLVEHEGFWVEKLTTLHPLSIPYARTASLQSDGPTMKHQRWLIPLMVVSFLMGRPVVWTLDNFLLAAFAAYLARISQTYCFDMGLKTVEMQSKLGGLEGFFSDRLPCRIDIDAHQSFDKVFETVQKQLELTAQHETYPRDLVARYPEIPSKQEHRFSVIVEQVKTLDDSKAIPDNDLIFIIPEDGKECSWVYNPKIFDDDSIARMLDQFTTFVQSIITDNDRCLAELSLVSDDSSHKILVEWNDTHADYPQDTSVHQLFENQVEKTPDAVAVVFKDSLHLTYRDLNIRANQLAHYLQSLNVGPDVLVGICVERSLEMVIGLLGILKAGGAYVPLDPGYPQERLGYMLENSQASILLTQNHFCDSKSLQTKHRFCLDSDWQVLAQYPTTNPESKVSPDHLAYVIYTSGSTGKPKGVAMPHSPLVNLIYWQQDNSTVGSEARTLQYTPISFDVSFQETFATLATGGTLVLITEDMRRDPSRLLQFLKVEGIERFFLPFVALQHLAEVAQMEGMVPSCLREVITAGEQLRITGAIANLFTQLPNCTLHNHYGPSETHVVTNFTLTGSPTDWSVLPPIGRPIANTQIYLLDSQLRPVPDGLPGELYIGGISLARGYLNRPDLTAERFIVNPFAPDSERLYKTGDLAKYLPNGNIEYLGRADQQFKIRGYRIEPGEVEAVLEQYPHVQQAVVVIREDIQNDRRLVAYVVVADAETSAAATSELRQFLLKKLPEYMVPTAIMFLEKLPLTPSGKVDRRALPAPNLVRQQVAETFVAPRNELEQQLTNIWQEVLGIQPIGVQDNFFDLGGHSLLALSVFAQIEQKLGENLPLVTLFQAPTIEQLVNIIGQKSDNVEPKKSKMGIEDVTSLTHQSEETAPWSSLVPIQPKGSKPPLFCIHALGVSVLYYRDLANYLGPEQPFYALQPRGADGKQAPLTRIEDMAANYIKEIQTIQPNGPYFLGGSSFGGWIAWEMAQQLVAQGQKVALLALFDTAGSGFFKRVPLRKRVLNHLYSLLQLGPDYIFKQVRGKSLWLQNRFNETVKKPAKQLPQDVVERPLTHNERKSVVESAHKQAEKNYVLRPYPGLVTCFRATTFEPPSEGWEVDPQMGWGDLAGGGLEIYDVIGDHDSMFREPNARVLAEKVRACLDGMGSGE